MSSQSAASLGIARLLAGDKNLIRICPIVPPGRFGLDVIKEIDSLPGLGESEARKALPKLKEIFSEPLAEQFIPYHWGD